MQNRHHPFQKLIVKSEFTDKGTQKFVSATYEAANFVKLIQLAELAIMEIQNAADRDHDATITIGFLKK